MDAESIYREKRLGIERPELSVGDGVSLKGGLTIIDKELRARLGKSTGSEFGHLLNKAKSEALSEGRTSLHFSSAPKKPETDGPHPPSQFMSSGEFNYGHQPANNLFIKAIENIHEDSKEYYPTTPHSKLTIATDTRIETEMQENFFASLKDVVSVIFKEIQEHASTSSESVLQGLMEHKNKLAFSKKSVLKKMSKSKVEDLFLAHESLLAKMDAQLGEQMQKTNLLKRLLIELLMFLDLQVLGMSKVRKLVSENKQYSAVNSPSSKGMDIGVTKKSEEEITNKIDNVTESWVDKHSLLQAENKQKLQKEIKRLSANQLGREGLRSLRRYKQEMAPTRLLNKIFRSKVENPPKMMDQSLLKISKKSGRGAKTSEPIWKRNGFISQREYSRRGDIKFYLKTNRKSLFKHPTTNLIAEKFSRGGRRKKKRMLSFLEHKRMKKEEKMAAEKLFSKKKTGFRDEIGHSELPSVSKKGQKLVQSVCSSKAENMTDSNIFFIKTHSGHQIKVKKCLEDAKIMLEEFKFDLASKQGTIQRNKESIAELASSVERLRIDVTLAKKEKADEEVKEKEIEIRKKEERILELQAETSRLGEEVVALSGMIVQLKRENENNLDEVTRMVKSKFKEIESRNRKERQVQRDLVIRFNLELEAKNEEIDRMISQYQQLRLLNQDLSKQLQSIKKHRTRPKPQKLNIKKKNLKPTRQLVIRPKKNFKKVKSTLAEKNMTSRNDISPEKVVKDVEGFKKAIIKLKEEVSKQGKSLEQMSKDKADLIKKLSEAEKALERFKTDNELVQPHEYTENFIQTHMKLAIRVARRKAELVQTHSTLNQNKNLVHKLIPAASEVEKIGMRLAKSCQRMSRAGQIAENRIRRKEMALEDQAHKDRHFMKVNQINTNKLDRKNQQIMDLELKNSKLKMQIEDLNRILKARQKSSGTSVDKRPVRINRTKSPLTSSRGSGSKTFNRKRLYHNSNKAGSLSSFHSLSKPFSQTLNSDRFKDSSKSKSRPRSRLDDPKKSKYDQRIKNSFKNLAAKRSRNKNPRRKAKSKIPTKFDRGVNLYQFMGTRSSNLTRVRSLERQLEEMKKKHEVLQEKYAETHNDLLKSRRAMQMEALREKKQSERSLRSGSYQEGLKTISEAKETRSNSITHGSIQLIKDPESILIDPRKSEPKLSKNIDVSGLYKTVIEELNISRPKSRDFSNLNSNKKLQKQNETLKSDLQDSKKKIRDLRKLVEEKIKSLAKLGGQASSHLSRLSAIDEKLEIIQVKLAFNASELKESLNLFENNLGEEVKDKEMLRIQKKLTDKIEDLAIAERNLAGLNKVIKEKNDEILELKEELENRPAAEGGLEELKELRKKIVELEKKKKNSEEQISGIQARFKILHDEKKTFKNKAIDLEEKMETLEENIKELRRVKEEKEKLIAGYERRAKAGGLATEGDTSEIEKKLREERERELAQEDQEVKRLKSIITEKEEDISIERNKCARLMAKISNYEKELKNWQIRWNLHENRALQALMRAGRSSPKDSVSPTSKAIAMAANPGFSFRQLEVKGLRNSHNQQARKSQENSALRNSKSIPVSPRKSSQGVFAPQKSVEITRSRSPTDESIGNLTININNLTVQTVKYLSHGAPDINKLGSLKESNSEDNLIGHREKPKKRKVDFKTDLEGTFRVNSKEVNQIIPGIEEFSLDKINPSDPDTTIKTDGFVFGQPEKTQNNFSLGGDGLNPDAKINKSEGKKIGDSDFENFKKQSGVGLFKNEDEEEEIEENRSVPVEKNNLPDFGNAFGIQNAKPDKGPLQKNKEPKKQFFMLAGDDSNLSDESSSLGSLIQSRSNNNSKENNSFQSGNRKLKPNPILSRGGTGTGNIMNNLTEQRNAISRDGITSGNIETGKNSTGNLIMTGNSVISVVSANNSRERNEFEEEGRASSPKITKSLFDPRSRGTDAGEKRNSFQPPSENNFQTGGSDFDGLFLEAKKEEDSDVFSAEDNIFEVDQNLHVMMKHKAATPGMTVQTFSQRYINGETEEEKAEAIKKQEQAVKKRMEAQNKARNEHLQAKANAEQKKKNLFNTSVNMSINVSGLNMSELQNSGEIVNMYPRVPMPAPGGHVDLSFGGKPPLMFDSNTSFATGGQVLDEDLIRDIQLHAQNEKEKKLLSNSGVSPRNKIPVPALETVIEEENRPEDETTIHEETRYFDEDLEISNSGITGSISPQNFNKNLEISNSGITDSISPQKTIQESRANEFFTDQTDLNFIIDGFAAEKKRREEEKEKNAPKSSLVTSEVFNDNNGKDDAIKNNVVDDIDDEKGFDFGARIISSECSDSDDDDDDDFLFTPKTQ